jgi:hypothetical protein
MLAMTTYEFTGTIGRLPPDHPAALQPHDGMVQLQQTDQPNCLKDALWMQ